jgi:hypothetical protein
MEMRRFKQEGEIAYCICGENYTERDTLNIYRKRQSENGWSNKRINTFRKERNTLTCSYFFLVEKKGWVPSSTKQVFFYK